MPHLMTSTDPRTIAQRVVRKTHRFTATVSEPDLALGPDRLHLYGSDESTQEALREALSEHPLARYYNEVEYLDPDTVNALRRATLAKDDRAKAIENKGRILTPT